MSLNSIFNSLWNMDLTFIVKILLLLFSTSVVGILGYNFLINIVEFNPIKKILENYDNLSEIKKRIVTILILVPFTSVLFLFFLFMLSILGLE